MAKQFEIYKCEVCGNVIEVLFEGAGEFVCCEEPMTLMIEKTHEEMKEKHLPIFEKGLSGDILIKVGEIPHPMTQEHYIKMIEVFKNDGILERKYLLFNQKPEFLVKLNQGIDHAREYCNIHGLWYADFADGQNSK